MADRVTRPCMAARVRLPTSLTVSGQLPKSRTLTAPSGRPFPDGMIHSLSASLLTAYPGGRLASVDTEAATGFLAMTGFTYTAETAESSVTAVMSACGFDLTPPAATAESPEPAAGCSAVWDSFSKPTLPPHEQQVVPIGGSASDEDISVRSVNEPTDTIQSTGIRRVVSGIEEPTSAQTLEPILIVDSDPTFREAPAQEFRAAGYRVITADTGERAFLILRDWQHPVGWVYSRSALTGLIDGAILADEYHDCHPEGPPIISAQRAGFSARGDILLAQPTLAAVLETVRHAIDMAASMTSAALPAADGRRAQ